GKSLHFLYKKKWISVVLMVLVVIGIFWASKTTPTGFVPTEDRGMIFADIELPAGASLDRTQQIIQELYSKTENVEGMDGVSFVKGRSLLSGAGTNYAIGFIKLKDWADRKDESTSAEAITQKLF